ncbi:MAG TPA: LacI family DNA-binding transcriptional regulator [Bryobacteraceae bacterium]|nr:LacI family DNA-binding transcriptional regulator [Bryobacteraceae bacterium]
MKTQVTVRAIAESAGVSAMTVSRALRGEPNVDEKTASRICDIADRLGYRRNLLVSTVMSTLRGNKQPQCSSVIAFLTAESSSFRPEQRLGSQLYFEGARMLASKCGFTVEEFVLEPKQMDSKTISRILYARNIRGLLIGPLCRSCGHLSLDWKEFSSSAISINLIKPDLDRCSVDPVQSVNLAIRNLKRLGYRRIGYGISPFQVALSHHRSRAMFLDYQCQLPPEQTVGLIADWSLQGLSNWLKTEKPDAIIGHGDEILSWLNALGIQVPMNIGYVDINMFEGTHVPLAGVVFDYKSVGASAVNMVISNLLRNNHGLPEHPVHCYIQGKWRNGYTVRTLEQPSSQVKRTKGKTAKSPKAKSLSSGTEPFHPLARSAKVWQWQPLNLRKHATHSYKTRKDISKWEEGLGLPLVAGQQTINSVPFQLIDEKPNAGKGFVLLQTQASVTIPTGNHSCEAVFFLVAAGFIATHGPIAEMVYKWADGKEESHPLIAYFTPPPESDVKDHWMCESGVQDWWPTFPHFCNETSKMFRLGKDDQDPVEWRYLYTLQWLNRRPKSQLSAITIRHLPRNDAKIAILAATLMAQA